MNPKDKIALIGIVGIIISALNFLITDWSWITTLEFASVCIIISYLVNKAQRRW